MAQAWAMKIYKSGRWAQARREALRLAHYSCRLCDSRASEVHHIIPLTRDNANDDNIAYGLNNLMCLCWRCHDRITKGSTDAPSGFMFDDTGNVVKM
jgi:5-methylcytosine-specific restriction endonuclease McrA